MVHNDMNSTYGNGSNDTYDWCEGTLNKLFSSHLIIKFQFIES